MMFKGNLSSLKGEWKTLHIPKFALVSTVTEKFPMHLELVFKMILTWLKHFAL